MDLSTCKTKGQRRGCGADIYWIVTEAGKKHPIDREPEKMWVMTLSGDWKMVDCFRSHFASCPYSRDHSGA